MPVDEIGMRSVKEKSFLLSKSRQRDWPAVVKSVLIGRWGEVVDIVDISLRLMSDRFVVKASLEFLALRSVDLEFQAETGAYLFVQRPFQGIERMMKGL